MHKYRTVTVSNKNLTGFPHFFIWILPGLFQEVARSKLRFSRTVICSKKCRRSLNDHLSIQEKYSVIISHVFFINFREIHVFHFSRAFPGLEIFFHSPDFEGFSGA